MSHTSTIRSTWPFLLALILVLICAPAQATWKGKVVEKDGVNQVMNPATAEAKPETVKVKELWRVGGDDEDVLFGVITDVIADRDGNFYLLDSQLREIQVYAPDGENLRTIGREGEGPGEFRMAFNLLLLPNGNIGVLQTFPSKLVGLTPEGEPADDFRLPWADAGGFQVLFTARNAGDQLAIVYGLNQFSEAGFSQSNILSLVDASGKTEKRLHSQDSAMSSADAKFAETEFDTFRNNRWSSGPDGRVYAATHFGEYKINVWGPDGKLLHVIHRDYPTHVRTDEQKETILGIYKGFTRQIPFPNIKYVIEPNWNPIQAVFARDDGTLWVQTSRTVELEEGKIGTFDVFDKDGHLIRQVTLEGQGNPREDGLFMVGDRLFVVTDWLDSMMALQGGGGAAAEGESDEDAEPMEVICYQLN